MTRLLNIFTRLSHTISAQFFQHPIVVFFKQIKISREAQICFIFLIIQSFIASNKYYLALVFVYMFVLYLFSKNIYASIWLTLISVLPFHRARHFIQIYIPPTHSQWFLPVSFDFFVSMTDLLLFAIFLLLFKYRSQLPRLKLGWPLLLNFICLALLLATSSYFSDFPFISFFASAQLIKYVFIFIISVLLTSNKKTKNLTIQFFVAIAIYLSSLIILEKIYGGQIGLPVETLRSWSDMGRQADEISGLYRPAGIADDPNFSASLLLMLFPLILVNSVAAKPLFSRRLSRIAFLLTVVGILFTYSRAVWMSLIVVCAIVFILFKKFRLKIVLPKLKKLQLVVITSAILFALPLIILRLKSLQLAFTETGGGVYRLRHMQIAADIALSRPLVGRGLENFKYIVVSTRSPEEFLFDFSQPHNIIAQVWAELGFFGVLIFSHLFILLIRKRFSQLHEKKTPIHISIAGSIFAYILCVSFYPWFIYPGISEFFWVLIGIEYDS